MHCVFILSLQVFWFLNTRFQRICFRELLIQERGYLVPCGNAGAGLAALGTSFRVQAAYSDSNGTRPNMLMHISPGTLTPSTNHMAYPSPRYPGAALRCREASVDASIEEENFRGLVR